MAHHRVTATAWVATADFDRLPGVCVKTGEATEVRVPVAAEYVPVGLRWLMVLDVWGYLFARTAAARRRHVRVPVSAAAFRRHRSSQAVALVFILAAVAVGAWGSLGGHSVAELIGWSVALVAFVARAWAHDRWWVDLLVDRRGAEITIRRCHPAFARAAGRLRSAR